MSDPLGPPTTMTVNVGTLSTALALAIQQASSSGHDTVALPSTSASGCSTPRTYGHGHAGAPSMKSCRDHSRACGTVLNATDNIKG